MHLVAQICEWNLCPKPMRIFRDPVHRLDGVVPNQVYSAAQHHKRFEIGADAVTGKFEIPGLMSGRHQSSPQRSCITPEILLELLSTWPVIIQYSRLVFGKRNDRPLIKN